jgi:uncharacterized membrane protein
MTQNVPRGEAESPNPGKREEPVRHEISQSEFFTVMAHFYRGEISRANMWRSRLDATFNWAILTSGTTISFAFGSDQAPHVVIIINTLLVSVFLFIEARRYRYYELWSSRVRALETEFLAPLLLLRPGGIAPTFSALSGHLAEDLLRPHFTVGVWEAVGRRLRRNYIWVFLLLACAWAIKIAIHPAPVSSPGEFLKRAAVGALSGSIVLAIGVIYNGVILAIAFLTIPPEARRRVVVPGSSGWSSRPGKDEDLDVSGTFMPVHHERATGTLEPKTRTPRQST